MADKELTALPAATEIDATDLLLMVVDGDSRKVLPGDLGKFILSLVGLHTSSALSTTDLNTLTVNGFYKILSTDALAGNAPLAATSFCVHASLDTNRVAQLLLTIETGFFYVRTKNNAGVWQAWRQILAATDIQSSNVDVTAGKLMSVGAFGLGADAVSVASFDALVSNGWYRSASSTTTGIPVTSTAGWVCYHANVSTTGAYQMAHRLTGGDGQNYTRTKQSGVWGAWRPMYSGYNILGTVGLSGGVPTDAIIESDSNSYGTYLKLASGDMICTTLDRTVSAVSTADGALFKSADLVWTYPVAFVDPPVLAPGGTDDLDCWVVTGIPIAGTAGRARIKSTVSKSGTVTFGLIARGRWAS